MLLGPERNPASRTPPCTQTPLKMTMSVPAYGLEKVPERCAMSSRRIDGDASRVVQVVLARQRADLQHANRRIGDVGGGVGGIDLEQRRSRRENRAAVDDLKGRVDPGV